MMSFVITLVEIFRDLIWKILPKSITTRVDADSDVGDFISVCILLSCIVLIIYLSMILSR